MKKLFMTLLMLSMVFTFTACGGKSSEETQAVETQTEEKAVETEETAPETTDNSKATIGDFEVVIKDYELIQDDEGKDAVFVSFDFTNNSKDVANFDAALYAEGFQNGVELGFATIYNGERDDSYDNKYKDIQPGTTIDVKEAYLVQDQENPITIKVVSMGEILGGASEGSAEKEFVIK